MNLIQLFDVSLIARARQAALEFEGQSYTFGDLESRSNRVANLLASRGLRSEDRLCLYLANCVEMIDLYLACLKLGVIFVPINILYREREIAHILSDAEPTLIIADEALSTTVTVMNRADLKREALLEPDLRPSIQTTGDSPAGIIYTSGTTGTSKGAVLSHNNFLSNAVNLLACWQITESDRLLLALPLFHVHGLGNGIHCWLASGCRMLLLERFSHQTAEAAFHQFRPTLFFGVPTMYVRLLAIPPDIARAIGGGMRLFVSGSAALSPAVMQEFRELFGHSILERYGMSETLMNISNPYASERRAGSIGFPLPGVSVRIVDGDGAPVATGQTGELQLKGPNVFQGYWRREDATMAAFADGFFRTGDLATVSEDGYFTLCGRKSDLIISGGFNILPAGD
jgi:malonyl-CoA/methylmalonyl-CoA synthetase